MKTLKFYAAVVMLLGIGMTFHSCQETEIDRVIAPESNLELRQSQAPSIQQMATAMAENGISNGATFIDPLFPSAGFIVTKDLVFEFEPFFRIVSGEICVFRGEYGKGDFWRENPDGTVSVKLVSKDAEAAHFDFATLEEHLGTGHFNVKYTGDLITIPVPFPPFEITLLAINPDYNAQVVHGHARVTLNGESDEDDKKLRMWWTANPGGQGMIDFELVDD